MSEPVEPGALDYARHLRVARAVRRFLSPENVATVNLETSTADTLASVGGVRVNESHPSSSRCKANIP